MADHHDDMLDSALNLLRARPWAGPATNPILEKQFMHPNQPSRGTNPRLILGIVGALIGCGAVAAATSPAWRAAIFGGPPPTVVAAARPPAEPAAPAPIASAPARPAPIVVPAPRPVPAPEPATFVAAPTPAPEAEPVLQVLGEAVEPQSEEEWLRANDPDCYYQQALAAYMDRYMAGDAEGCARIARAADGRPEIARFVTTLGSLMRLDMSGASQIETRIDLRDRFEASVVLQLQTAVDALTTTEGAFQIMLQTDGTRLDVKSGEGSRSLELFRQRDPQQAQPDGQVLFYRVNVSPQSPQPRP